MCYWDRLGQSAQTGIEKTLRSREWFAIPFPFHGEIAAIVRFPSDREDLCHINAVNLRTIDF